MTLNKLAVKFECAWQGLRDLDSIIRRADDEGKKASRDASISVKGDIIIERCIMLVMFVEEFVCGLAEGPRPRRDVLRRCVFQTGSAFPSKLTQSMFLIRKEVLILLLFE